MKNKIGFLTLFMVSLMAVCVTANGYDDEFPVYLEEVKINGDEVYQGGYYYSPVYDFEKNDDLEVKVRVTAGEDIDDVQIEASLRGYDHNDLMEDITDVFDMKEGVIYTKKLTIPLRLRMDQDRYKLRIRIDSRDGDTVQYDFDLEIDSSRHSLMIRDVILSPENEVKAGRALLAAIRLKNYGEKDENDILVKVSMPELGISASDYVDELEKEGDDDDSTTTEELYMRIPTDAKTGEYMLRIEVTYDDGDEKETQEMMIKVKSTCDEDPFSCAPKEDKEKTVLTLASGTQTAKQGGGESVYPITITNEGTASKTYVVSADGANWATFRLSPSNVLVIGAGESKAVNIYVAAGKDAPVGEQTFTVTIKSGEKTLKELPMKVNVSEGKVSAWSKLKKGLEIGLVILVILVVILGLIIGFNKLKGEEEDTKDKEGETYY